MNSGESSGSSEQKVVQSLRGSLPCFVCGYELKGLSIRSVCPECGTAVRGTILYRVDPQADEFKPIRFPKLTAWGIRFWGTGAATSALALWVLRLSEYSGLTNNRSGADSIWSLISVVALLLSAVGAIALVRPNRWIRPVKSILAGVGVLWYAVILAGLVIVIRTDMDKIPTYGHDRTLDAMREFGRMIFGIGVLGVLSCLRPMARELVRRSLAMRTGRVDRQTILAMSGVVLVGLLGDTVRWLVATGVLDGAAGVADFIGRLLVVFSSMLLTLGLISAAVDSWRISNAILTPSPTMAELFGEGDPASSAAEADSRAPVSGGSGGASAPDPA